MNNIKEKFNGDKARYISGIIMIVVLAVILFIDNKLLTWVLLGFLLIVGFKESLALWNVEDKLWLYVVVIASWIAAYFNDRPVIVGLFSIILIAGYLAYSQKIELKMILPFIYPLIPFLTIFAIYIDFKVHGIIWLILIVALCDIGAYFGGKAFGKAPFSPTSPKKTIEGAIIGLATAVVIGSIVGIWTLNVHFLASIVLSLIVGIASISGDLFESYLKRKAGVKDSGSIFPGHGGVLDRLDAMFFGAICMYFLLSFFNHTAIDATAIPNLMDAVSLN